MKNIYLASTSKQRKELLVQIIGHNFETVNSIFEEDNNQDLSPQDLVKAHSLGKAKHLEKGIESGIVIGSDCILYFNGEVLGKPYTKENAKKMLGKISGQILEAYTGIALYDIESKKELVDYDMAKLKIKNLSDEEIEKYVKLQNPIHNAGGITIQSRSAVFIENIEGDYYSIVGLPLFKLGKMFEEFGMSIFDYK